jgi:5'-AMP-activated protein kinase catalytic alpha subunit
MRPLGYDAEIDQLRVFIATHYAATGTPPSTLLAMYDIGKCLGKGSFGKVYSAIHKLSGLRVAIKTLDKDHIKEDSIRRKILQEVYAMRRVTSPNAVQMFEMFESSHHLMLVIEYAGGGDLLRMATTRGRLPESEAKQLFRQAVEAVKDCHAAGIIHRDVKLDNLLMTETMDLVKLCDFGVSKAWHKGQLLNDQCGTPAYLAPEIILGQGYEGPYVDIWSLGVALYVLINGTFPFKAKTLSDLYSLILRGEVVIPDCASPEAQDLIRGMLRLVPSERLSLEAVLSHEWFYSEQEETSVFADMPTFKGRDTPKTPRTKELNTTVLRQMEAMGFPTAAVLRSLEADEISHATATYLLMSSA